MDKKIYDSERKILEIIWQHKEISAKEIALIAANEISWSKTTTYTVIKKCVDKGLVEKSMPHFICRALVTKEEVQEFETNELIDKAYDGNADQLLVALLDNKKLSPETLRELRELILREGE